MSWNAKIGDLFVIGSRPRSRDTEEQQLDLQRRLIMFTGRTPTEGTFETKASAKSFLRCARKLLHTSARNCKVVRAKAAPKETV